MSDFIKLSPLYHDPDDELRVRASAVEAICTSRAAEGRQTHVITAHNAFSCKETPEEVEAKMAETETTPIYFATKDGIHSYRKAPWSESIAAYERSLWETPAAAHAACEPEA